MDWFINSVASNNPATQLFNVIQGKQAAPAPSIFDTLQALNQNQSKSTDEITSDPVFVNLFFQYPNAQIAELAEEITLGAKNDDDRMEMIQSWVVNNMTYREDKDQYGYDELWVPPIMTLKSMEGDCEDGAFLIMSLALNAGVNPDRLRFYGGEVKAGQGAAAGGHGWVAYQRSIDNEWVPIDFSYYPDLSDMNARIPMKEDSRYLDQYFIFEVGEIITSEENRVRNPDITYDNQGYANNAYQPGMWVSQYV